jgi:hypothetical protein
MPFYPGDSDGDEIESVPIERVGIPVTLRPATRYGGSTRRREAAKVFPAVGRARVDATDTVVTLSMASAVRFGQTYDQYDRVSSSRSDRATRGRPHEGNLR